MDRTRDLGHELRRRTAEAYRRAAGAPAPAADGPQPGALYGLEASPEPGLEWLVLEVEDDRCLVVPVDSLTWTGSSDVAVDDATLGPLSLRCGHGLWLAREALRGARPGGAVGADDLERARARRRQLVDGAVASTAAQQETDVDPDYLAWRRTLEGARKTVCQALDGELDEISPSPEIREPEVFEPVKAEVHPMPKPKKRGLSVGQMAIAASLAAVALGAGVFLGRLSRPDQPEVAVPWLLAPYGSQRGDPTPLVVSAEATSIALLLDAEEGDQVEVRDAGGEVVWSGTVGALYTEDEALVILPTSLVPPGDYEVIVSREGETEPPFMMRIERP